MTSTDVGHPLTPNPVPLRGRRRREAEQGLATAQLLAMNPDLLDAMVRLRQEVTQVRQVITAPRPVMWSGMVLLDSTGAWEGKAGNTSRAIKVFSPFVPVYVFAGSRQSQPPTRGAGLFYVPAATSLDPFDVSGTVEWSIYAAGTGAVATAIPIPAPPAGQDSWAYTTTQTLQIQAIQGVLTTDATVSNRTPLLTITDPFGNLLYASFTDATQAASLVRRYTWGPTLTTTSEGFGAGSVTDAIPNLTVPPGSVIGVTTSGTYGPADQWSSLVITAGNINGGTQAAGVGSPVNVTIYGHRP